MATKEAEETKRELERKAYDQIMVYNPLDEPYDIQYDRRIFRVPDRNTDRGYGKGKEVYPRYIARHYVKHMTDKILTERANNAVEKENERRINQGHKKMDKHSEQLEFESEFRVDKEESRLEVMEVLWEGLVKEHGEDITKVEGEEISHDPRPLDDQLMDKLESGEADITGIDVDEFIKGEDAMGPVSGSEESEEINKKDIETSDGKVLHQDLEKINNHFQIQAIARELGVEHNKSDSIEEIKEKIRSSRSE